jgi:hypothetical protein
MAKSKKHGDWKRKRNMSVGQVLRMCETEDQLDKNKIRKPSTKNVSRETSREGEE